MLPDAPKALPPEISSRLPPVPTRLFPADAITLPPSKLEEPTLIMIDPEIPPVEDPVNNSSVPVPLSLEVPLDNIILPLFPFDPALALLMTTEPPTRNSPEAFASPAARNMLPPVAPFISPA